jgi:hypothetical protein
MNPVWAPPVTDLPTADVIVVGAGSAGCCAAIAAARRLGPDRVLLLERYGFLGGTSTAVLDTFYGFFTPGVEPRKVVGGIPDEVVTRLHRQGGAMLRPNSYGAGTGVTYNPELLKRVWDELMAQAGVRVLNHVLLVDIRTAIDGRIESAVLASKAGFYRVQAPYWIDASGDADLSRLAGYAYEKAGDLEPAQTLTTTFRMANVNLARFEQQGGKAMMHDRMESAVGLPRTRGSAHAMVVDGCIATVAVRVSDVDATDVMALSAAEAEGRRQAFVYEQFFRDSIPGYESSRIIGLAVGIGVRETRRVIGEYRLTRSDCLDVARFDDRVLLCGAPIEDHRMNASGGEETAWAYVPGGAAYDVPYRCLVPKGQANAWVVGRCFSATHDAHASCRSMAQTMAMGQAAGVAASICCGKDLSAGSVSIGTLQESLRSIGAILETPREVANTTHWINCKEAIARDS